MNILIGIILYFMFGFSVWYMLLFLCPPELKNKMYSIKFISKIITLWIFLLIIEIFKLTFKK